MQTITISMSGDGDVELTRTRAFEDAEALPVFIALGKTLGDEPPRRRSRRSASAPSDDTATAVTTPETDG